MALEALLVALRREAEAEAERLLAEARADASARHAEADLAASRQREASLAARGREQAGQLEEALAQARLEARRTVLAAREEVLTRLFSALRAACPGAVSQPAYLQTLRYRIEAGMTCLDPGEQVIVRVPASLVAAVTGLAESTPNLTVVSEGQGASGVRLMSASGSVEVIDTLESRIARRRAELARRALPLLGVAP